VFAVIILLLERNAYGLKVLGAFGTNLGVRLALYTIFAILCLFQLTTVVPSQFLLASSFSLAVAVSKGEYIGMKMS
jgi:hypothetical protein